MKKGIFIFLIFFLVIATTLTKNSTKNIDQKIFEKKENIILLSPASASYDQFLNFEKRGNQFKKLIKNYADRHI